MYPDPRDQFALSPLRSSSETQSAENAQKQLEIERLKST